MNTTPLIRRYGACLVAALLAVAPVAGKEYFVAPDGDNRADGTSDSTPWLTVEHALKRADEGSTITLLEGVYDEALRSGRRQPNLTLQGCGQVRLTSQWLQRSIDGLTLRNLQFDAGLTVARGQRFQIENCAFTVDAPLQIGRIEEVTIRHCLLLGMVDLRQSQAITVAGCVFGEGVVPRVSSLKAVASSDHNSFANLSRAWRFGPGGIGVRHQFSTVAGGEDGAGMDRHSIEVVPQVSADDDGIVLINRQEFAGKGPDGTDIGP